MTWFLMALGLICIGLGLWGGPVEIARHKKSEEDERSGHGAQSPWDVIARPLEKRDEMIKIPEHRPWYMPGRDRRFHQGLLVGLGSGLLTALLVLSLASKPAPPNHMAAEPPRTPGETKAPGATSPPAQPTPAAPAPAKPRPASITLVVEAGDVAPTIASKLKNAGLIANEGEFLRRVAEMGADTRLKAGSFVIASGSTLDQIINVLIS